jgi:hypothetical protein
MEGSKLTEDEYDAKCREARHRLGQKIGEVDKSSGKRSKLDNVFVQSWLADNGMTIEIGISEEVTLGFSLSWKGQHLLREHLEARMEDIYNRMKSKETNIEPTKEHI